MDFWHSREIHPDYYQIPVADREALIAEEERAQRAADDEVDRRTRRRRQHPAARRNEAVRGEVREPSPAIRLHPNMPTRPGRRRRGGEADTVEARAAAPR